MCRIYKQQRLATHIKWHADVENLQRHSISQPKCKRNNKRRLTEHVYFSFFASGSLNWTHFPLHSEFIWIQSFEKIKSFSGNSPPLYKRELIRFTLFAEHYQKFKQGRTKRLPVFLFCILMLSSVGRVGFLLSPFKKHSIIAFACKQSWAGLQGSFLNTLDKKKHKNNDRNIPYLCKGRLMFRLKICWAFLFWTLMLQRH